MIRASLAALAVVLVATPAISGFRAPGGVEVNPLGPRSFETVGRTAASPREYWCAAADYAHRALGAAWTDRIYVVRGLGPSQTTGRRSAVQFSLDPVAGSGGDSGVVASPLQVGDSMLVQRARIECTAPPARF